MVRRCGYASSAASLKATLDRLKEGQALRLSSRTTGTYSLTIQYYFLPTVAGQTLTLEQLKAQHAHLNACYKKSFLDEVPQNDLYDCRSRFGDPDLQFKPLDASLLSSANLVRLAVASPGTDRTTVDGFVKELNRQGRDVSNGMLHVIFSVPINPGQSNDLTLLGFAATGGNVAVINYATVGSPSLPNMTVPSLAGVNLGTTLVHEVGHCLMLQHTFVDRADSSLKYNVSCSTDPDVLAVHETVPDLPIQVNPNLGVKAADLTLAQQGRASSDHRGVDQKNWVLSGTSYNQYRGCLRGSDFNTSGFTLECPWNYMDYSNDGAMKGWLQSQADTMRAHVGRNLRVYGATAANISHIPGTPDDEVTHSGGSSSFPLWAIVLVSVVGFLALMSVGVWYWWTRRLKLAEPLSYEDVVSNV